MKRLLPPLVVFLVLIVIETSFFSTLPLPWCFFPLVFSVSIYVYQHESSVVGLWWLLGNGLFLDFWHLGVIPGETIVYALVSIIVIFLSRRLFTNHSLYGALGCAFLSFITLHFFHFLYFLYLNFFDSYFSWLVFGKQVFYQTLFLFLFTFILFLSARRIRFFLSRFFISQARQRF